MAYTKSRYRRRSRRRKRAAARRRLFILILFLLSLYLGIFTGITWNDLPRVVEGDIRIEELARKLQPTERIKIPGEVWSIAQDVFENGIEILPERLLKALTPATETTRSYEPPISLDEIPPYSGEPYVAINGNAPTFTEEELTDYSCNYFADLDSLGRCGRTQVMLSPQTMPTEERGEIGMVKPTGWHTVKYQGIDGNYLYNRCHLIGYQLSGENANEKNLITGTRYLNVVGMLPYENAIADYIRRSGNHVLYRVTPIFDGDNLLASGVQMEAHSVEDNGKGIYFNIFCYNVQPGITIDYVTGDSSGPVYG